VTKLDKKTLRRMRVASQKRREAQLKAARPQLERISPTLARAVAVIVNTPSVELLQQGRRLSPADADAPTCGKTSTTDLADRGAA
jgi:hypothetical protein